MGGQLVYYVVSIILGLGYLGLIELGFDHQSALFSLGALIFILSIIGYIYWIKYSEKKANAAFNKNKKNDNDDTKGLSKREILKNKMEKKYKDDL